MITKAHLYSLGYEVKTISTFNTSIDFRYSGRPYLINFNNGIVRVDFARNPSIEFSDIDKFKEWHNNFEKNTSK